MFSRKKIKAKKKRITKFRLALWTSQLLFTAAVFLLVANIAIHIYQQPLELFSLIPGQRSKTPEQLWEAYSESFQEFSDENGIVTAPILAALVLVESNGDPWARPPWELNLSRNWSKLYAPASTAFGLMQITRGTMQEAERICARDPDNCGSWWSSRANPSHSVAIGSSYLKYHSRKLLGGRPAPISQKHRVALVATTHLCGPGRARRLVRDGFQISQKSRCGSHHLASYVNRVSKWTNYYERLHQQRYAGEAY